jgi:hypothetical protein
MPNSITDKMTRTHVYRARRSGSVEEHYRCADILPDFCAAEEPKGDEGFFRFGRDVICYGRNANREVAPTAAAKLFDASKHIQRSRDAVFVPFDVDEVANNLRYEHYESESGWQKWLQESRLRDVYYGLRPMLPVSVRKHLQKIYLKDWKTLPFPNWPVDRSVDVLFEKLIVLAMRSANLDRLPFVWFWPEGHSACAILTHDVETTAGRDFCEQLMDFDDAVGIKASFQVVPEKRYEVPVSYLKVIRQRGFEVNVQGLNHDGNLFRHREAFLKSAQAINRYAEQFHAVGFRSPILYRNIEWFGDLDFSYDLSVPNVARLEPQRGGCCTVMPFFLPGGMLELPLTTTEDYSLFNVLNDYSTTLWKQQIDIILKGNGLMTFLIHPDYVMSGRAQDTCKELLEEIARLRSDRNVWVTLPRNVDEWWRKRNQTKVVASGAGWRLEGPAKDQARIGYAFVDGDCLHYEVV